MPENKHSEIVSGVAVIACLLVVFGLVWRSARSPTGHARGNSGDNASHLKPDEAQYDFGTVSPILASNLSHTFVLRNSGSSAIRILKQTASCGCTVADLPKGAMIEPGGSIKIPVSANWADRDGYASTTVALTTDEIPPIPIVLTITGYVDNPLIVWPRELDFGAQYPGATSPKSFTVSWRGSGRPSVESIRSTNSAVTVRAIDRPVGSDPSVIERFSVQVAIPRTPGSARWPIWLNISGVNDPIPVFVSCRSLGSIVAEPESVLFQHDERSRSRAIINVRIYGARANQELEPQITSTSGHPTLQVQKLSQIVRDGICFVAMEVDSRDSNESLGTATLRLRYGAETKEIPIVIQ